MSLSAPTAHTDTCPIVVPPETTDHGYITDKHKYLNRLRRIEGQVRGINGMVDDERHFIDILTQVSAIRRALEGVALHLLTDHLRHCVADANLSSSAVSDSKIAEASEAITRLVRS